MDEDLLIAYIANQVKSDPLFALRVVELFGGKTYDEVRDWAEDFMDDIAPA